MAKVGIIMATAEKADVHQTHASVTECISHARQKVDGSSIKRERHCRLPGRVANGKRALMMEAERKGGIPGRKCTDGRKGSPPRTSSRETECSRRRA